MKKPYTKPVFSCEQFEVNQDIASGCQIILNFGGYDPKKGWASVCSDYVEMFGYTDPSIISNYSENGHKPSCVPFSQYFCDCYLTAVGDAIFTS